MRFVFRAFGFGMSIVFAQAGALSLGLGTYAWLGVTLPLVLAHAFAGFADMGGLETHVGEPSGRVLARAGTAIGLALGAWAFAAYLVSTLSPKMSTTAATFLVVLAWAAAAGCSAGLRAGTVRTA